MHQIPGLGENPSEWSVDHILSHSGKGLDAQFEILWSTGDTTWAPYEEVGHLNAMDEYCEAMGISHPKKLPAGKTSSDIPQKIAIESLSCRVHTDRQSCTKITRQAFENQLKAAEISKIRSRNIPPQPFEQIAFYTMDRTTAIQFSNSERQLWVDYSNALRAYAEQRGTHPGLPPAGYDIYVCMYPGALHPRDYPNPISMATPSNAFPPLSTPDIHVNDVQMSAAGLRVVLDAQSSLFNTFINQTLPAITKQQNTTYQKPFPHWWRGNKRPKTNYRGNQSYQWDLNGMTNFNTYNINDKSLMRLVERLQSLPRPLGKPQRRRPYKPCRKSYTPFPGWGSTNTDNAPVASTSTANANTQDMAVDHEVHVIEDTEASDDNEEPVYNNWDGGDETNNQGI
ncbi:hypothetical protein BDQ17DRAFT_1334329 [Cyathus striatus]|nr:hypothetical protein BDQ17DRAFT_1334329 [Cyathus striatus]